jgi:hypothetical protein
VLALGVDALTSFSSFVVPVSPAASLVAKAFAVSHAAPLRYDLSRDIVEGAGEGVDV